MFDILAYPFMQRAIISGIIVGILLASLGVYVVVRKMAFFGDGIAHASLAGIALAMLVGFAPLPVAILYSVIVALAIYGLEKSTKLSSDTIIGILFTSSMALGVVLMSVIPGFQPELISFLFGNILTISQSDMITVTVIATVILTWLWICRHHLTFTSLDADNAKIAGINTEFHNIVFHIALATSVVLGVKLLGIVLVSALLLIPPATSRLVTVTFRGFSIASIFFSVLSIILGLLLSFYLDAPSGATIILTAAVIFAGIAFIAKLMKLE